jgi:amino acid adenylation domain-containing protein/thioester reductase-like protein
MTWMNWAKEKAMDKDSELYKKKFEEARSYWFGKLADIENSAYFPTDFTRQSDCQPASYPLRFTNMLADKLLRICKDDELTLYTFLLAVFKVLIYKYAGTRDISVISPLYLKNGSRFHLGNYLVFRDTIQPRMNFIEFLMKVTGTVSEGYKNQFFPLKEIFNWLSVDPNDMQLFRIMMVSENIHNAEACGNDDINHSRMNDITLSIKKNGRGIEGTFIYNSKLFLETTISRISEFYFCILMNVLVDIKRKIKELEIISQEEKDRLLYTFNNTEAEYPSHKTLQELFAYQVKQTPEHTAAALESQSLSYRELNSKANQLARLLRDKGVRANSIVGIMADPSLEMAVAIWAVLKAGGAYLPVGTNLPGKRIHTMLADSGTGILLTTKNLLHNVTSYFNKEILDLEKKEFYSSDDTNLERVNQPGDLAYVIYTSGSTGSPKGVLIKHRNIVNYVNWRIKHYHQCAEDITFQTVAFSFDGFGANFYPTLLSGGELVFLRADKWSDADYIRDLLKNQKVTNFSGVPSFYRIILEGGKKEDFDTLRFVVLAGEKADKKLIALSEQLIPGLQLINEYGPTENSVTTTVHFGMTPGNLSIIGTPLANNQVYVLDEEQNLKPIGVPGELCIAGSGLAGGYLNQPELTAEKFINISQQASWFSTLYSPNHPLTHSTIYRTGDLLRWLPDGRLEILGRMDNQVNIRGFRVELEEIQNQLLKHDDIREAVVITNDNIQGEKYLCAYLVPNSKEGKEITGMRDFLLTRLPDYMIPMKFVKIERIPLTSHSKIDKKALSRMEKVLKTEKQYTPPRNATEEQIIAAWKKVLKIEQIGVHDNFFELGGDSYKCIQVVSFLVKDFDISVSHLFQYHTPAELAQQVTPRKDNIRMKIEDIKNLFMEIQSKESYEKGLYLMEEYKEYRNQVKKEKIRRIKTKKKYRHILLTGAPGYLGSHLVFELLKNTSSKAKLYLLARGNTTEEAKQRVERKFQYYFGKDFIKTYKDRFEVVKGELREDYLGMDENQYQWLSERIETVVHAAADVRHFGVYSDFYETNVKGTERLLEFARTHHLNDFHYISTLSVGNGNIDHKPYILFSESSNDVGQRYENIYVKSKFEAEQKVLAARENGLSTSIYRMGNLTFHSESGKFQENIEDNAFYANMKTFISLGIVSENFVLGDLTCVDLAARAIVHLMIRKKLKNQTFHLKNHHRLTWKQMDAFLEAAGVKIQIMGSELFLEYLLEHINDEEKVGKVERFLVHSGLLDTNEPNRTISLTVSDRTNRILKKLGFQWPEVSEVQIEKMIDHCQKVGFLRQK